MAAVYIQPSLRRRPQIDEQSINRIRCAPTLANNSVQIYKSTQHISIIYKSGLLTAFSAIAALNFSNATARSLMLLVPSC
jgi:hypothetical protein